ncbi:hypothetical protein CesoFtcFv8_001851 [Champsocephalus esox]|uniref:Uncharacterized protein n=1 Tax=Champsocephalus esox TaxID=159716 RepID=A0AAN8D1T7_9TELE|nr:hypothetical protein CesoFtcFv8_001851 [Champsocephalus esox]
MTGRCPNWSCVQRGKKERIGHSAERWLKTKKNHYYHAVEDILRKATGSGNLIYQGKRIQLFPDYPPTVVNRRKEFTPAREILRNKPDVRYGLLYPARLIVTHGGQQHSFTDPKAALDYATRHFGAPEARPKATPDG